MKMLKKISIVIIILLFVVVLVLIYDKNKTTSNMELSNVQKENNIEKEEEKNTIGKVTKENNIDFNIAIENNTVKENTKTLYEAPELSIKINKMGEDDYWMEVNCNSKYGMNKMSGYELYRSKSKDGNYELINTKYYGVSNAGFGAMDDKDTMYYYKIREFKEDENNNKEYTDFSNIVGPVNKDYKK